MGKGQDGGSQRRQSLQKTPRKEGWGNEKKQTSEYALYA